MIKEILKGSNIPIKEDIKLRKKSTDIISSKNESKKINSVLYNFIKYKKINLKKKSKKNIFEKANSAKTLINKNKSNEINNKKNSSSNSKLFNKKNITKAIKYNIPNNSSFTVKRKERMSRDISANVNSLNFEVEKILTESQANKSNDIIKEYNKKYDNEEEENEYENGCSAQKNKYIKDLKILKLRFNNKLLMNNLEKEFEIRSLKKKIKNLKDNRKLLKGELNDIKKKNNRLNNKMIQDEKKRKKIIYNTVNIYKNNNKIISKEKEFNLKNIFSDLKNLKYNYENNILKDKFISGIEQLLILSKISNDNSNNNSNKANDIYYNITNIINNRNKYINDIKKYSIQKLENKKYYNYCFNLCRKLNLNNIEELYKYLKNLKSNNDKEARKIIKMKHVLFDENTSNKKHKNITASVDNLISSKKFHNYNYEDLQKFFIENNSKKMQRNNFSAKVSNITIKSEKSNNFSNCLTEKDNNYIESESCLMGYKTCKNRRNYYLEKREELKNKINDLEKFRKIKRIKSNIINIDKIRENENNYLYYSYKQKIRNIPHNNKTFKNIETKKTSKERSTSKNNLTCYNENKDQTNVNRIFTYKLSQLNNNLNNSINQKLTGAFNSHLKDKSQDNNYINSIKIKKKSLNIKIPSLKMIKNFKFHKTINYNK